ncbi:hypothetical protein [Streptomyces xanthochromogenes]|uniref:hypothetical protein n=1 Tax=Streptomyces xanthochromogenes TaxID=67384 RepID=UPI003423080B
MEHVPEWLVLSLSVIAAALSAAMTCGWVPPQLRRRPGPVRLLGVAGLATCSALLVDVLPRLAGACPQTVTAFSYTALALVSAAVLMVIGYDLAMDGRP